MCNGPRLSVLPYFIRLLYGTIPQDDGTNRTYSVIARRGSRPSLKHSKQL